MKTKKQQPKQKTVIVLTENQVEKLINKRKTDSVHCIRYEQNQVSAFLSFWSDMAYEAKIQSFIKFAKALKSHWSGIVN